ncbi:MAG TPA: selenocysteine-specific translation elongation factor [Clostridia bacterium]|nr:selenocysteine-specific translation elongation factor [Clostridia bacterium]
MKNVIIGTAGHIDHGKTTLIRALTGHETDRLNEEKKRGISIQLGFTYFDLPSGRRAGIIDVPGHEKFIRNMLTGVGGMDVVILVIAADEGVMPQTKEHLDILSLLEIKKGIIVITKSALVDEEWLKLVKEDIREKVEDTFLENSEIVAVDSIKGTGISELINKIDMLTEEAGNRDINAPARMPIDRIFTIVGFGTVVTGTLTEGRISVEDTLEILPQQVKVRIRNIQVHGQSVNTAYAGQRVAINLANVKLEDIERGQVLAQINSMEPTMMIDAKLNLLRDIPRSIKNHDRVRIYHGASEVLARVTLLDKEEGKTGESIYVQFRLEEITAVKKEDRLVVRYYSPMETLGGAVVIDANPKKHNRFDENVIKDLAIREKGSSQDIIEKQIDIHSKEFPDLLLIAKLTAKQLNDIKPIVSDLASNNRVIILGNDIVIHKNYYENIKEQLMSLLTAYHKSNPLKLGMLKEEVRSRLFPKNKGKSTDTLIDIFAKNKIVKIRDKFISLYDFEVVFSPVHKEIREQLEHIYLQDQYSTPKFGDIVNDIKFEKDDVEQVFNSMLGDTLVKLNPDIVLHIKSYENAKAKLADYINKNGSITLSELRDILNTSRKYAIALLEYFDREKVTRRTDDKRTLY